MQSGSGLVGQTHPSLWDYVSQKGHERGKERRGGCWRNMNFYINWQVGSSIWGLIWIHEMGNKSMECGVFFPFFNISVLIFLNKV
jgi:hypothetical protein